MLIQLPRIGLIVSPSGGREAQDVANGAVVSPTPSAVRKSRREARNGSGTRDCGSGFTGQFLLDGAHQLGELLLFVAHRLAEDLAVPADDVAAGDVLSGVLGVNIVFMSAAYPVLLTFQASPRCT